MYWVTKYRRPPDSSRRSRVTPEGSAPPHARVNDSETPTRGVACTPTPPPANHAPREKNPVDANTRAAPCVNSTLTGRPNCRRLSPTGSACTTPSPRISIIGDTATFTPDAPVSRAILLLKYEVPTPPAGPAPSALPTTRGMLAPI